MTFNFMPAIFATATLVSSIFLANVNWNEKGIFISPSSELNTAQKIVEYNYYQSNFPIKHSDNINFNTSIINENKKYCVGYFTVEQTIIINLILLMLSIVVFYYFEVIKTNK